MEFPYFIDEKTEHRNVKGFEGLLEEKVVIIMTEPVLKYIMPCVPFLTAHPVDPTRYQSFLMWTCGGCRRLKQRGSVTKSKDFPFTQTTDHVPLRNAAYWPNCL